jgi:hypothetical protein
MRLIAFALSTTSLLVSSCDALAAQGSVPRFNIESTCREARAFAGTDKDVAYNGCLKDEADARAQLAKKWTSFRPQDRTDCVSQGAAPLPSYVELLTCLEMSADAAALNSPGGLRGYKARGPAEQNPPIPPIREGVTPPANTSAPTLESGPPAESPPPAASGPADVTEPPAKSEPPAKPN